jgi:hypothetical protein
MKSKVKIAVANSTAHLDLNKMRETKFPNLKISAIAGLCKVRKEDISGKLRLGNRVIFPNSTMIFSLNKIYWAI